MEKSRKNFHSSPRVHDYDEMDGFLYVPDEDLDIPCEMIQKKSPARSPFRNMLMPTVMSALSSVVSSENLLVTNIAKSVLTGAAATLSTATMGGVSGMAMGALIAGGIYAFKTLTSKPLRDVLKSLSPLQQKQLINRLRNGMRYLGVQDMAAEIINRSDVKEIALEILSDFLEEKYGLRIMRS